MLQTQTLSTTTPTTPTTASPAMTYTVSDALTSATPLVTHELTSPAPTTPLLVDTSTTV